MFSSYIEDLIENWLWEKYDVPASVMVRGMLWEEDKMKDYNIPYRQNEECEKALVFAKNILDRNKYWFSLQTNDQAN